MILKPPGDIADEITSDHGPRGKGAAAEARWMALRNAIADAIERARADGLVAGFRDARGAGTDTTATLAALGVSEAVYQAAVKEMADDERTTT